MNCSNQQCTGMPDYMGGNGMMGMPGWQKPQGDMGMPSWPGYSASMDQAGWPGYPMEPGVPPTAILPAEDCCKKAAPFCVDDGRFPLAMSYVPMQKWSQPLPIEKGFKRGTIFAELDLPFMMGRCK